MISPTINPALPVTIILYPPFRMKIPLLLFFFVPVFFAGHAQQFTLLKDINPGSGSSNICYLTDVNNTLFFAANNGINGMELWKTNGTDESTVLVKDINPGAPSSSIGYLTQAYNVLFFVANNGIAGTELWKSDGTDAGTNMVKDIRPGSMGSNPSALASINGILYFAADDAVNGVELWKTDGTEAGTVMVKDINPYSGCSYPQSLANVNGILFFAADNGIKGMELWKSDGTAAGTVLVKDIWNGADGGYPADLTDVNGVLFFAASNGTKGTELWKSDGSAAGTVMVKDIWNNTGESYPYGLMNVNGVLFFSADNGTSGAELWKSDGTLAGTALVKDVWPGVPGGAIGNFSKVINKLIFTGNDGVNGYKTWQSDGSAAGTIIATGVGNPGNGDMQELVETDNTIFASIRDTDIGRELWAINYNSILPLELLEFKGRLETNDALLTWTTNNEIKTKEFVVERNTDGSNYIPVGNITAANTPGTHQYHFTDPGIVNLNTEIVYYRLKQTDADNRYTYSKVISLFIMNIMDAGLFPNPAINEINISISTLHEQRMYYRVFDNAGRIVMQETKQVVAGTNQFPVDINKLAAGVYYIKLTGNLINRQFQFVKQ